MTTPDEPAREKPEAAPSVQHVLLAANHDIRSAMHGLAGMLALLRESGLNGIQQDYAESASNSARALFDLIERITDLSLIESGTLRAAPAPFDLAQEMRAICSEKTAATQERGCDLQIHYPPSTLLQGDVRWISNLLADLLDWAEALSPKGGVSLRTGLTRKTADICCVQITLEIDGAPVSMKPVAAMRCTALARMMGGSAGIRPGEGGAAIWCTVELPFAAEALSGLQLLLITEHPATRAPLAALLEAQGLRIDICSCVDAMRVLSQMNSKQIPYRFILFERPLPGLDIELLVAAIRNEIACRQTCMLLLDDASCSDRDAPAKTGFSACLPASASPEDILAVLRQLGSGRALPYLAADLLQAQKSEELALAGRRILVADDNPVNRKFAARLLEQLGCVVALAEDGHQAEQMHAQSGYDLILMDCDMPQLDGYEATRRIRRAEEKNRHTPIVALTACASPGDRENCIAAGMDDFIAKPAQQRELAHMLARWLPPASSHAGDPSPDVRDELEAVRDMFGKDFAELAMLYLADSPARIAALRTAGTANDPAHTAKIAHAFSGSCASIGASALSRMCRELEVAAKSGVLKEFKPGMAAIEAEYLRICERLRALLQ